MASRYAVMGILLAGLVGLSACSYQMGADPTPSPTPTPMVSFAPSVRAQRDTAGCIANQPAYKVRTQGVIRVGTGVDYAPFASRHDGKLTGFDIDLMNALAARLCMRVQWAVEPFDSLVNQVIHEDVDVAMAAISVTPERASVVAFSAPYFISEQALLVPQDSPIDSMADVDTSMLIGVQTGTTGERWMREAHPTIPRQAFGLASSAVTAMEAGQLDGVVLDGPVVSIFAQQGHGHVGATEPTNEVYAISVNRTNPGLTQALNMALSDLIATGDYADIYAKWMSMDVPDVFTPNGGK